MRPAIEALVARVPEWEGRQTVIRPLLGNPREELFTVDVDGHEYVVRSRVAHDMLGFSTAKEAEATRRAADVHVGPAVVAELPATRTLITELVHGGVLDGDQIAG